MEYYFSIHWPTAALFFRSSLMVLKWLPLVHSEFFLNCMDIGVHPFTDSLTCMQESILKKYWEMIMKEREGNRISQPFSTKVLIIATLLLTMAKTKGEYPSLDLKLLQSLIKVTMTILELIMNNQKQLRCCNIIE